MRREQEWPECLHPHRLVGFTRSMHGSSWVPWLLMGPFALMVVAKLAYDVTGVAWIGWVAVGAMGLVVGVGVAAFVANWRRPAVQRDPR